ncbi:MAG TPA: DUF2059 domain-containing protein [Sulfurovum sp.]|nr:DUF2059 domain-containing protein [Sulfurovum sp.]
MLRNIIKSSLCLVLLSSTSIMAKEPIPSAVTVKAEGIAEAYEMLEIMNMDKTFGEMIEKMMHAQTAMFPLELQNDKEKMAKLNKVMLDFMNKYLGWDKMKDDMAALYANNYTANEIRELKAFYLTPVGQKTLEIMPKLAAESAALTQSKLLPHMEELQDAVKVLMLEEETK